jgi:hypothetical protein
MTRRSKSIASILFVSVSTIAGHAFAQDYGPDTCRQGFVWRDAFPGDHVCVTPGTRRQAAEDNRAAEARVSWHHHDYGPDTCKQGFVWREAGSDDHVCVTPGTRAQTADDNAHAAERYAYR